MVEGVLVHLSFALLNSSIDNCEHGGSDTHIPQFLSWEGKGHGRVAFGVWGNAFLLCE